MATDFGGANDYGIAVTELYNGKLIVAGTTETAGVFDFAIAKYNADGTLDTSFGSGGTVTADFAGANDVIRDVIVTRDGNVVVAGFSDNGTSFDFALARYTSAGLADATFGDGGRLTIDFSSGTPSRAIVFDGAGGSDQLVLVGGSYANADYVFSGSASGALQIAGSELISLIDVETLDVDLAIGSTAVSYPSVAKEILVSDMGAGSTQVVSTAAPDLDLVHPSVLFDIDTGLTSDDVVRVASLAADYPASLAIDGQGGTDLVIVSGPISLAGHALSIHADTVDIQDSVTTGGGAVTLSAGGDINVENEIDSADGNVTIQADNDADGNGRFHLQAAFTTAFKQQRLVTASDANGGDWFGSSVAIEGDTAIIAADGDDDNGLTSGSVYVFTRSGGVWSETQKIVPPDGASEDYFGYPLSLSGDTVAISAPRHDAGAIDTGAVYVYTRTGGVWSQQQKLTASDAGQDDWFGTSVVVNGDTILVGATQDDDAADNAGAVYVFTRSGGVWTQQQKLTASDATFGDAFGTSLAIDGNNLVVGAMEDDHAGSRSGSAYLFQFDGNLWNEQQKLTSFEPAAFETFGVSVAIEGDTLLVGADTYDGEEVNAGAVFAFVNSSGVWTPQQKITRQQQGQSDRIGSVSRCHLKVAPHWSDRSVVVTPTRMVRRSRLFAGMIPGSSNRSLWPMTTVRMTSSVTRLRTMDRRPSSVPTSMIHRFQTPGQFISTTSFRRPIQVAQSRLTRAMS